MEKTVSSSQEKEIKINNLYSIQQDSELGSGSFGKIIKSINIKTKEEVAIFNKHHISSTKKKWQLPLLNFALFS